MWHIYFHSLEHPDIINLLCHMLLQETLAGTAQ